MSKDKRKNQFTLGDTPRKDVLNDLPDSRYADEEGVETTNILAPKGEAGPVEGYSSIEGTDEYLFKGIKPGAAFLHPPRRLIEGRIIYRAKYYGHLNVKEPRGAAYVRDAIDKLKTVVDVLRANNPGEDVKTVDLSISIRGITCVNKENKEILHQHPIHSISFSADDKRGKAGSMLAYIAKGRPPARENICYVLEVKPKQAKEVIATIGQAFELAYRRYADAKKAREGFEQLKQVYHTASDSEKEKIRQQLEVERVKITKQMEEEQKREKQYKIDPKFRPSHTGSAPVTMKEDSSMIAMSTNDPQLMAAVQREANAMELESKLKAQKKDQPKPQEKESSIVSKWSNIATAMEPFQVEPSLDPDTQYLVPRFQTLELDDAIADLNSQIEVLEEAFSWRTSQVLLDEDLDMTPFSHPLLDSIDEKLREIEATTDDLPDIPDMPSNYVMDEFLKAREKAHLPKEGAIKNMAAGWYKEHHD